MHVNTKQRKILKAIFTDPVKPDISWEDIMSLLQALGANIKTGSGSVTRVEINGVRGTFHRPHPRKVTDKGAVKAFRELLKNAGVKDAEYD